MKADIDRQGLVVWGFSGKKKGFLLGGSFLVAFVVGIFEGKMDIVWKEGAAQLYVVQTFFPVK